MSKMSASNGKYESFPIAGASAALNKNTSQQVVDVLADTILKAVDTRLKKTERKITTLENIKSIAGNGGYYVPNVDADGNLTWSASSKGMPKIDGVNIQGERGEEGKAGKDGVTPHIGDNGNWFIGETDTGVCAAGKDGLPGEAGADGYTPVKGTDYWTEADKAEIIKEFTDNCPDYVVECGTTNGWKWEKWYSGKYICWGIFTDERTHYTTVNGFYGYYSSDFLYPITFPEPPIIHFNCKVGSGFAAPAGDVARSSSTARCYALSTASGTVACVWEMYVVGRWK